MPSPVRSKLVYASPWARSLAQIIDLVIALLGIFAFMTVWIIISSYIILVVLRLQDKQRELLIFSMALYWLLGLGGYWLYFTIMESSRYQGTIGKLLVGIKVVDLKGNRISFLRANARFWGNILSLLALFIGYIMVPFTKKKQSLHDIIAGTLVVKSGRS